MRCQFSLRCRSATGAATFAKLYRRLYCIILYFFIIIDCVGAIDGTHIPCIVDAHLQAAYRNRKGYTSQNVLAVVDFDLKFTYLVAGWEGSIHDSRVLRDAMSDPAFSFPTPPGDDHDKDDMEQGGDTIGQDAAPSTQQDEGHQTEMG
ncbi:hypothetical protein UlMin_044694 [Ulmus minor]